MNRLHILSFVLTTIFLTSGICSVEARVVPHHYWPEYFHQEVTVEDTAFMNVIAPLPDSSTVRFPHITVEVFVSVIDSAETVVTDAVYAYSAGKVTFHDDVVMDSSLTVETILEVSGSTQSFYDNSDVMRLKLSAIDGIYFATATGDTLHIYHDGTKYILAADSALTFSATNIAMPAGEYAQIDTTHVITEFRYDRCGQATMGAGATEDIVAISGLTSEYKGFLTWAETSADSADGLSGVCTSDTLWVNTETARGTARTYNYITIR